VCSVSGLIGRSDDFPFPAAGTQPVDSENVPVEGNVETSHLLEQVRAGPELLCYFCSDSHRSRLFVALSVSCAQKIRISRGKTCSRKYKHYHTSQNLSVVYVHLHWTHQVNPTQTNPIPNTYPLLLLFARSPQKPRFSTGTSSNSLHRLVLLIYPLFMQREQKATAKAGRCGCGGRLVLLSKSLIGR
jgi:hypothetical protein